MPGVQRAGMVQTIPIRSDYMLAFTIQGRPPNPPGEEPSANYRAISPGYFAALCDPAAARPPVHAARRRRERRWWP